MYTVNHTLIQNPETDSSIPAHSLSKLVLVTFHPLNNAKGDAFITIIYNILTIFYDPSEKCKALVSVNCLLVSVVNFIQSLGFSEGP
jgi:hypothetical protein